MKKRRYLFELTPLGKADNELRRFLDDLDTEEFQNYDRTFKRYKRFRIAQLFLKVLVYASIVTTVAATLGFEEIKIIQRIASYLGTSLLLLLYGALSYLALLNKEIYHVQREILISKAAEK